MLGWHETKTYLPEELTVELTFTPYPGEENPTSLLTNVLIDSISEKLLLSSHIGQERQISSDL